MPADTTQIWVNDGTGHNFKPPSYPQNGGQIPPRSSINFKAQGSAGGAVNFYAYTGTGQNAVPAFTSADWPYTAPKSTDQSKQYTLVSSIKDDTEVTLSLTDPLSGGPYEGANGTINVGGGDPE